MNPDQPPADTGLQLERTLLAWHRTALAVAGAGALATRLTAPAIGWPAVALGAVGVAGALAALLTAGIRYRRAHRALTNHARLPPAGLAQTALACAVFAVGCAAALFLVMRAR